jgi:hypothetical protein
MALGFKTGTILNLSPSQYYCNNKFIANEATCCYRLEGQGIKSQWEKDFLHPSRSALGATHHIFPRGKAASA